MVSNFTGKKSVEILTQSLIRQGSKSIQKLLYFFRGYQNENLGTTLFLFVDEQRWRIKNISKCNKHMALSEFLQDIFY